MEVLGFQSIFLHRKLIDLWLQRWPIIPFLCAGGIRCGCALPRIRYFQYSTGANLQVVLCVLQRVVRSRRQRLLPIRLTLECCLTSVPVASSKHYYLWIQIANTWTPKIQYQNLRQYNTIHAPLNSTSKITNLYFSFGLWFWPVQSWPGLP